MLVGYPRLAGRPVVMRRTHFADGIVMTDEQEANPACPAGRCGASSTPRSTGCSRRSNHEQRRRVVRPRHTRSISALAAAVAGRTGTVRNIVMMTRRAPVPGTGWGCMQCGLPLDGAIFVACDRCVEVGVWCPASGPVEVCLGSGPVPVEVCLGSVKDKKRLPVGLLAREIFGHDCSKHPEVSPTR